MLLFNLNLETQQLEPATTLQLDFNDLRDQTANFVGYAKPWTTEQKARLNRWIESGLRQFYYQAITQMHPAGYRWNFLKPVGSIVVWPTASVDSTITVTGTAGVSGRTTITANTASFYESMIGKSIVITSVGTFTILEWTSTTVIAVVGDATSASGSTFSITADYNYPLPRNVAGLEGDLTYRAADSRWFTVRLVPEGSIRRKRQQTSVSAYPQYAAYRPLIMDGTEGQRLELMVWPNVGTAYTLDYRFNVNPPRLSGDNVYPYGGPQHAETILRSCMAVAELATTDQRGERWSLYQERLAGSIAWDQGTMTPEHMGYNYDGSDDYRHDGRGWDARGQIGYRYHSGAGLEYSGA